MSVILPSKIFAPVKVLGATSIPKIVPSKISSVVTEPVAKSESVKEPS